MPTLDQSYCLCCDTVIFWNGSFWEHDGEKHTHPARPVNELEIARAEIEDLKRQLEATRKERDTLRQMLLDEQDRYQELPY